MNNGGIQISVEAVKMKIADLVLENDALRYTVQRQADRIAELEKKLAEPNATDK